MGCIIIGVVAPFGPKSVELRCACRLVCSPTATACVTAASASRDRGLPLMICMRRNAMLSLIILLRSIMVLNEPCSWCSLCSRSWFSHWSWLTLSCRCPRCACLRRLERRADSRLDSMRRTLRMRRGKMRWVGVNGQSRGLRTLGEEWKIFWRSEPRTDTSLVPREAGRSGAVPRVLSSVVFSDTSASM